MIRAVALVSFACVVGAGGACADPHTPVRPTVSLRMQGTPPEALVIVDEEAVGQLDFIALHGVALPPGGQHVPVKARGFFPWDKEVEAKPGGPPIELEVTLLPVPD